MSTITDMATPAQAILTARRVPDATYRLQFRRDFTFRDATELVPYLHDLGIGDCYASPILKARADSTHGYDVCDHRQLNPTLGSDEDFAALAAALRERGMGFILDVVPNHMGIGDPCNTWWMDVLENGPSSPYATFFDIDWHPVKAELENKVLLPILGDQYGNVLEGGQLRITYDQGALVLCYYEHQLPLAPRTYIQVLRVLLDRLTAQLDEESEHVLELQSILTALNYLPERTVDDPELLVERQREKEIVKRRIASLCEASPEARAALDATLEEFNGKVGQPASFDQLDALIAAQPYRLAFWQVAAEEINYRRFFDINDLAALRVELPEVFAATHELILRLLADGSVTGLRIDHPDGLWDPPRYFRDLQERYVVERARAGLARTNDEAGIADGELTQAVATLLEAQSRDQCSHWPLYVVAEKILSEREPLPQDWAVDGTTGYDFLSAVTGLFVAGANQRAFDRIYRGFIASDEQPEQPPFDELVHTTKQLIMRSALSSEIQALSQQLARITEKNRRYRDFTLRGITTAVREVIACLDVYRTYITGPETISARDRHYITAAVAQARRRNSDIPRAILTFLHDTLLLRNLAQFHPDNQGEVINVVMKFQQITGPVMAKSVEDTAFYRYNRLVSLNDVGGSPAQFGSSVATMHHQNNERQQRWPHALLTTTTHDTKRSEDVRARISVLSELPGEWEAALDRWRALNEPHTSKIDGVRAPDANDEYLLYQTLLGAWPFELSEAHLPAAGEVHDQGWEVSDRWSEFAERIVAYMRKATREAKVHTSWINPDEEYDAAIERFVRAILDPARAPAFLADLRLLQARVAYYGQFNALAQVLLKLTVPGVPDIYQGNELWDLSLVDPDNRRPVDYKRRRELLDELRQRERAAEQSGAALARELLGAYQDGRIKLYLTTRALHFRRAHADLFQHGDYQPLEAAGEQREHLFAFSRTCREERVLVAVPRLVVGLTRGVQQPPTGAAVWGETWLPLPHEQPGRRYRNQFTGEVLTVGEHDGAPGLELALVFAHFPVALLERVGGRS